MSLFKKSYRERQELRKIERENKVLLDEIYNKARLSIEMDECEKRITHHLEHNKLILMGDKAERQKLMCAIRNHGKGRSLFNGGNLKLIIRERGCAPL